MSELIPFLQYIKRPFYIGHDNKINLFEILVLGGAYLLLACLLGIIIKFYCVLTHIQYTIGQLDITDNILLLTIIIVILAPIKEEVQMRILLRPTKVNLLLFNVVMILTSSVFVYYEKWQQVFIYLLIIVIISLFFMFCSTAIKILYKKYFFLIFYFSASLFAILHITNYSGNNLLISCGALILIAPQFF